MSLIVSCLSLIVSFLAFWRGRPSSQLHRDQQGQMRVLTARTVVLWDQMLTVMGATSGKYSLDPYVFGAMRVSAHRLEEALDKAIGLGLWSRIVGDDPTSLPMYTALVRCLTDAANQEISSPEPWTKEHLVMGMVRLLDACAADSDGSKETALARLVSSRVTPEIRQMAYTYPERSVAGR